MQINPMSNVPSPMSGRDSNNLERRTLDVGLQVNDLRKSFTDPAGNRIDVLRGVSFSVDSGESIAIMGPSGTGKSTLLHLLGGLEAPDNGSIALGNFEVDRAQASALAKFRSHQVGLVFQFHYLLADLSAAENVALPLLIGRTRHATAMQQAIALLTEMDLGSRIDHPISHLSGGEQQRGTHREPGRARCRSPG
jgi:lipoprotein-releasing system ATP-binding protein